MNMRKRFVITGICLIFFCGVNINMPYIFSGVAQNENEIVIVIDCCDVSGETFIQYIHNQNVCEYITCIRAVREENVTIKEGDVTLTINIKVYICIHRIYTYITEIYNWVSLVLYMTADIFDCVYIVCVFFKTEPPKIMTETKGKIETITCFLPASNTYFKNRFCIIVRKIKRILTLIYYCRYRKMP